MDCPRKHTVILDIDENRPDVFRIGHPSFIAKPTNPKQIGEILNGDLNCCANGLLTVSWMLIHGGHATKEQMKKHLLETIEQGMEKPEFQFRPDLRSQ